MCRSFYEVQIIAPPSAWQQLAKMGEGIKLTLGDDPEITDGRWEEPFDKFRERNEAARFVCQAQTPRDHVAQVPTSIGRESKLTRLRLTYPHGPPLCGKDGPWSTTFVP